MNLYRLLKLKKSSSPQEIRDAYRRESLKHHPDRAGDRTKFEQVNLAYRVLSDPKRRARYDETGEYDDGIDKTDSGAAEILVLIFSLTVKSAVESGVDVRAQDVARKMRELLAGKVREIEEQRLLVQKGKHVLENMKGRFSEDEGFLNAQVDRQLVGLEMQLQECERALAIHRKAQERLRGVRYRHEAGGATVVKYFTMT